MTVEERVAAMWEAPPLFRVHPMRDTIVGPDGVRRCTCPGKWITKEGKEAECPGAGKHPRLKKWPDRASRNPKVIQKWLKQYPGCNWGLVLGGHYVGIDIDDQEAFDWLEERARFHGVPIPHTIAARSGRGLHLIFRSPIFNARGRNHHRSGLYLNMDVRGYHGQLIAAGSLHKSGVNYEWLDGCHPADLNHEPALIPDWMMREVVIKKHKRRSITSAGKATSTETAKATTEEPLTGQTEQDKEEDRRRLWENNRVDIAKFTIRRGGAIPKWKLVELFSWRKLNHERIKATWDRNRGPGGVQPFTDQTSSAYELSIANSAACEKWTPQQIVDLIIRWRIKHFPARPLPSRSRLESVLLDAYLLAEERGLIRKKRGRKKGFVLQKPSESLKTPQLTWRVEPAGGSPEETVYSVAVAVAVGDDLSVEEALGVREGDIYSMGLGVGVGGVHVQADVSVHADVTDLPTPVSRTEVVVDIAASRLVDLETIASAGLAVHCDCSRHRDSFPANPGISFDGPSPVPARPGSRHSCRAIRASMFPARRAYRAGWAVAVTGAARFRGG